MDKDQVKDVYRAYLFGSEAHAGQQRVSGEPYISHPVAVAKILADMSMDHQSIMAAILHDVIEDTPTAKDSLVEEFGEEIAELVDGVSKLTQIEFESKAEEQAENFRKMLLAVAKDIRVILIKLADRLHNMRTLGPLSPARRRRIARETIDIYVPIASRLGMNAVRLELEELGFAAMYPMRYRIIKESVNAQRGNRREVIDKIMTGIKRRLRQDDVNGEVVGREKHLFSIYQKMKLRTPAFHEVFDVFAFRLIVQTVDECYRALGVVHNLYKPVPGKFKDYIAIPKANGYQSLHTILFGPFGVPIEIQIRTVEMDSVAEEGIAAHWRYKGSGDATSDFVRAREWMKNLLDMQKNAGNSLEFIENVKIDLFPDEVYVFTPQGKILELPRGATAVDFAYSVHTDVGNTCVAAKIDRQLAPLRTPLYNGQTVEIITASNAKPNPAWLDFVVTAKARSNIHGFLKNLRRDEAISLGSRLLDKALSVSRASLDSLPGEIINAVVGNYDMTSLDDLLEDIGLGNRMPQLVAKALVPDLEEKDATDATDSTSNNEPLVISGTEGMVVSFAKCCRPIPGDPILGFVSAGRGIVIHNQHCHNVGEYRKLPEKWIDVKWEKDVAGDFSVELRVDLANQRGALAIVASVIADMEANIETVNMQEKDGLYSSILFTIGVQDRKHLATIMRRLRSISMVVRIIRMKS
ncbi:MAG: bifunctional GTP diphosphokinase/guanosine-3',5'-bis pyrophosphate 3'-pyrophosphohydrolase [Gammaproteobacteria bacterium]|nr:MAG: bifunctional GTP diphosphokinase/guanosine-3',5'-bis pyrophosphate 3'-pyrophosphohydrolase [Gammaproteobacteria bacterium]